MSNLRSKINNILMGRIRTDEELGLGLSKKSYSEVAEEVESLIISELRAVEDCIIYDSNDDKSDVSKYIGKEVLLSDDRESWVTRKLLSHDEGSNWPYKVDQDIYRFMREINKVNDNIWHRGNIETMPIEYYKGKKMLFSDNCKDWFMGIFEGYKEEYNAYPIITATNGNCIFCKPARDKSITKEAAERDLSDMHNCNVKIEDY